MIHPIPGTSQSSVSEASRQIVQKYRSHAVKSLPQKARETRGDYVGNVFQPGLSPYQMDDVVGKKLQEIAETYQVPVGTTKQDSINAMEDILCDEYALEFAFEGSRFYDLCRLARHKNADSPAAYGANFGGKWLAKKLAFKNPTVALEDENNWYLPFK